MSTTDSVKTLDRLYGPPGEEFLLGDLYEAAERWLDDAPRDTTLVIEEWTTTGPLSWMPRAEVIVDWLIEHTLDEVAADLSQVNIPEPGDPELTEHAEALRTALAKRIHWVMADKLVAEHRFEPFDAGPGRVAWRCEDAGITVDFPESIRDAERTRLEALGNLVCEHSGLRPHVWEPGEHCPPICVKREPRH